ncbi:MAG: glucose-6-phosphate dehydrogenase, partial [Nitrospirae bacterium]|nr:glucose-6-phosphate dehydrogenase [Nitrospirota bacterium]
MAEHQVEPHVFIILGATGDLTRRKLLPALYHLRDQGILESRNTLIVGAAKPEMGEEEFRRWAIEGLQQAGWPNESELRVWCEECLYYQPLHEGGMQDYGALAMYLRRLEHAHNMPENRVFYLALPPDVVPIAMERLDQV